MKSAAGRIAILIQLAAYFIVAAIYTFPLIQHPAATFPAGNDTFGFIWNNWWISYAIARLHTNPFFTQFVFAPFTLDLRLHTFGFLYGLLFMPLMLVATPVTVLNVQIFATIVLNGYAASKLVTDLTKNEQAGFVSGLLIASLPAINFHFDVGRASCSAIWPAMFAIRAFLIVMDRPTRRGGALLAIWVVATLAVDQQVAFYCIGWMVILLSARFLTGEGLNRSSLKTISVAAIVVLIPAYALFKPFVTTVGYTVPGSVEAFRYSYPLHLLWTPSMLWNVYGSIIPLSLIAGGVMVRRIPLLAPWMVGAVIFLALSLGPVVMGTHIPLPFALLQRIPGFAQFRTPYRFQMAAALGAVVVAGVLVSAALHTPSARRRQFLLAAIGLAVVTESVVHRYVSGFALQSMPSEAVYTEIARDPRDCVVLEVPFGIRSGTDQIGSGESLNYYQPVHRKRMINGMIGRIPFAALDYYRHSPALMFLAHEPLPPGDIADDLRLKIREIGVGYVVIHTGMMETGWREETLSLLDKIGALHRVATGGNVIAFRVGNE